jgi:hypothetical protein
MHPLQRRYVDSVRNALGRDFPEVAEVDTGLGALLLVAARHPLAPCPAAVLAARFASPFPGLDAEALRLARRAGRPDPLGPNSPGTTAVNRVADPVAYFAYLHFRGVMQEDAARTWQRIFRHHSPVWSFVLLAVLLALSLAPYRVLPGSAGVFWSSWMSTMSTMMSVYAYQSLAGQAYWVVSLLVGASMLGIGAGALMPGTAPRHRLAPLAFLGPALLFPAYGILARLPLPVVLTLLLGLNFGIGLVMGRRFALTAAARRTAAPLVAGAWFAIDLLGATLGLFAGAVLLCWWSGFQTAGLACAGVAAVVCLVRPRP